MGDVLAPAGANVSGAGRQPRSWAAARAAPVYVPAAVIAIGGWSHRWVDEDAFINFRILDNVFAGHGPVFNAGERVEAATSTLWLAILAVARLLLGPFLGIEWIAVIVGLAAAVAAFALAGRAALRRHGDVDGVVVPVGPLLVASVAVVWDFATSGLEMGLVWLWLAACWYVLVTIATTESLGGGRRRAFAVVIGLAPLVRPELGVMMLCFVAAWFVLVRPRRVLPDLVAMFALPVAYQVFRMGYFAAIVPNTAIAKDANGLQFDEGWRYLSDFVGPYRLWLPMALIVVVVGRGLRAQADRRMTTAGLAMLAAAGLGGAYIVAIGGDYMHGRLLLPAFFALALPASVVVRGRDLPAVALGALATVWALVGVVWFRPPAPEAPLGFLPPTIADWRTLSGAQMFPEDFALGLNGGEARELYDEGVRGYFRADSEAGRAGRDPDQLVVVLGAIGVPGHRAGPDVWVVDLSGLAEPIAARSEPLLGRPAGHRKLIDTAWYDARFGGSTGDGDVIAARHALSCEPIDGMLDAISEPLTVGRFFSNIRHSVDYTRLTIPSDPHEAEALLCPPADDR